MGASDGKIHRAAGMPVTGGGPAERGCVLRAEIPSLKLRAFIENEEPLSGPAAARRFRLGLPGRCFRFAHEASRPRSMLTTCSAFARASVASAFVVGAVSP